MVIGVVCLPDVAAALRAGGLDVVTGDDFRACVGAIQSAADDGPVIVVAADGMAPGLRAWLAKTATHLPTLIVRTTPGAGIVAEGALEFALPASVDELLATIRQNGIGGEDGAAMIGADGSIAALTLSVDAPKASPWDAWDDSPPVPVGVRQLSSPPASGVLDPLPWEVAKPAVVSEGESGDAPLPWEVAAPTPVPDPEPSSTPLPWEVAAPTPERPPAPPTPTAPARTRESRQSADDLWHPIAKLNQVAPPTEPATSADAMSNLWQTPSAGAMPRLRGAAPVISVLSPKGGTGKTSTSRELAARAAGAGFRVTLVDANLGQGGQRYHLGLATADVPSMLDVAHGVSAASVILPPERINAERSSLLEPIGFAVVLAPPSGSHDPDLVTWSVVNAVIDAAASVSDLVIVDTQVSEVFQVRKGSYIRDVLIPRLVDGSGWAMMLTNVDIESATFLAELLDLAIHDGVAKDRFLLAVTSVDGESSTGEITFAEEDNFRNVLGARGVYLGAIAYNSEVAGLIKARRIPFDHPAVAGMIDTVLYRVSGKDVFAPREVAPARAKRRWFGRKK